MHIGCDAGLSNQGPQAVAVGRMAGQTQQGENSIAISFLAGVKKQAKNSIILNASSEPVNSGTGGFYINPIRSSTVLVPNEFPMVYNPITKETKYTTIFASLSNVQPLSKFQPHESGFFRFNVRNDATFPYVTNSGV